MLHDYSAWSYRLRPIIGFTLRGNLAVFTRSDITPTKVNRFGWNLECSEYIVGGWPQPILGAIRIVATVWEAGEIFCQVNNARFHRFPVGQISRNLTTTTSIGDAMKLSEQNFQNFIAGSRFYQKNTKNSQATSGCHNYAMITDSRKFTIKWSLYGYLVSIFTVRINLKLFPWTVRFVTRNIATKIVGKVRCPILGKPSTPLSLCRLAIVTKPGQ